MSNLQTDIHDFHIAFGHATFPENSFGLNNYNDKVILTTQPHTINLSDKALATLRLNLLREEVEEGVDAVNKADPYEIVDAIGDILVLTLGTGCVYHLALDTPSGTVLDFSDLKQDAYQVFTAIDLAINDLEQQLHFTCSTPNRALLFASRISRILQDIVDLCYAHAAAYEYDLEAVLKEIHRSNMSKLGEDGKPVYREDGKILKGANYSKPNLKKVLNESPIQLTSAAA